MIVRTSEELVKAIKDCKICDVIIFDKMPFCSQEKSFISFVKTSQLAKTARYNIIKKESGEWLGEIWWDNGWRRYVWSSDSMVKWSSNCTKMVVAFIDSLMEERDNK